MNWDARDSFYNRKVQTHLISVTCKHQGGHHTTQQLDMRDEGYLLQLKSFVEGTRHLQHMLLGWIAVGSCFCYCLINRMTYHGECSVLCICSTKELLAHCSSPQRFLLQPVSALSAFQLISGLTLPPSFSQPYYAFSFHNVTVSVPLAAVPAAGSALP